MKREILLLLIGALMGWIITVWINSLGKYQVTNVINPQNHISETVLLNTRSGAIARLYNFDNNLMFGKPEVSMKVWQNWQTSKTNTPTK